MKQPINSRSLTSPSESTESFESVTNFQDLKTQDVIDTVAYYLVNHVMKHFLEIEHNQSPKRKCPESLKFHLLTNAFTEAEYQIKDSGRVDDVKEDIL